MLKALLLSATLAHAGAPWPALDQALARAKTSGRPVMAEFTASWCYSCYFMEAHVFDTPEFRRASAGLELARVDIDQPDGRALKDRYRVRVIPTFLLLGPDGGERSRIVGERPAPQFASELQAALGPAAASPEDRAVATLSGLLEREDDEVAARFAGRPAPASLKVLRGREDWRYLEVRLAARRDGSAGAVRALVRPDAGCELAADLLAALRRKPRRSALRDVRGPLDAWAERRVWTPAGQRCADFRSGVMAVAGVEEALGDEPARRATLAKAAAAATADSERSGLGNDRNADDNRRYFLELSGDDAALERLYPRLVEAYPADYVYAFRFAKWLAGRGRYADALPWVEKASRLCYAANRLSVTALHAEILAELRRKDEAAALLERDIRAYRATLPEETRPLEQLLRRIKRS